MCSVSGKFRNKKSFGANKVDKANSYINMIGFVAKATFPTLYSRDVYLFQMTEYNNLYTENNTPLLS